MDNNEDITIEDMLSRLDPADVAEMEAILQRQRNLRYRREVGHRVAALVALVIVVAVLMGLAL